MTAGKIHMISIYYSVRRRYQHDNCLGRNLEDMAISLNKYLRKHHSAESLSTFGPGQVKIVVIGAEQSIVEPLIAAFHVAMFRDGFRLLVVYSQQGGSCLGSA